MRPYSHPMIDATIRNAGPMTRVVACNIRLEAYTARDDDGVPDVELAAQRVACAVVDDLRGSSALNDCHILRDPHTSSRARRKAGERNDLRNAVGTILMNLANTDVHGWRAFIDVLACAESAVPSGA